MKNDISTSTDIKLMVDEFYIKVREDDLLGPIFSSIIKDNWTPHLEKMYGFWETVLLNVHKYSGSPFQKHIKLPIDAQHFERWLSLFHATLDQYFAGAITEDAKKRATQMGIMFQYKLKHIRNLKEENRD